MNFNEDIFVIDCWTDTESKENDLIAMSLLKAGECYEAMDDKANAKKTYKEILKLNSSNTYSNEAQTRLNKIVK